MTRNGALLVTLLGLTRIAASEVSGAWNNGSVGSSDDHRVVRTHFTAVARLQVANETCKSWRLPTACRHCRACHDELLCVRRAISVAHTVHRWARHELGPV